jgi:hypothetical protein
VDNTEWSLKATLRDRRFYFRMPDHALRCYLALWAHTNDHRETWVSAYTLARLIGRTMRTVWRHLEDLEAAGFVEAQERGTRGRPLRVWRVKPGLSDTRDTGRRADLVTQRDTKGTDSPANTPETPPTPLVTSVAHGSKEEVLQVLQVLQATAHHITPEGFSLSMRPDEVQTTAPPHGARKYGNDTTAFDAFVQQAKELFSGTVVYDGPPLPWPPADRQQPEGAADCAAHGVLAASRAGAGQVLTTDGGGRSA